MSGSAPKTLLSSCRTLKERLKDLSKPLKTKPGSVRHKAFLNPLVFFLTDDEKQTVDKAIAEASADAREGTAAKTRAKAIVRIAQTFLRVNAEEERS